MKACEIRKEFDKKTRIELEKLGLYKDILLNLDKGYVIYDINDKQKTLLEKDGYNVTDNHNTGKYKIEW